jgi:hypothetical protein
MCTYVRIHNNNVLVAYGIFFASLLGSFSVGLWESVKLLSKLFSVDAVRKSNHGRNEGTGMFFKARPGIRRLLYQGLLRLT